MITSFHVYVEDVLDLNKECIFYSTCHDVLTPNVRLKKCRGRDLNPRTPARQDVSSHEPFLCFDLKSCAVGRAWLPLQTMDEMEQCGRRDSNPGKRLGGPQS